MDSKDPLSLVGAYSGYCEPSRSFVDSLFEGNLDTTTALIYDSVHAFALALNELTSVQQVRQKPLDCSGTLAWAHGNSLVNYMKMVEFIGLSGPIKFDASGLRTQFAMDLMELQMPGLVTAFDSF